MTIAQRNWLNSSTITLHTSPQFNMLNIAQRIQKQLLDNRFLKGIPNAQFLSYTYEGKGTDNFALIGCISKSYFDKTWTDDRFRILRSIPFHRHQTTHILKEGFRTITSYFPEGFRTITSSLMVIFSIGSSDLPLSTHTITSPVSKVSLPSFSSVSSFDIYLSNIAHTWTTCLLSSC